MGKKRRNNPKLGFLEKLENKETKELEVKLPFSDKALGIGNSAKTSENPESVSNLTKEFKLPTHVRAQFHTNLGGISQKSKTSTKANKKNNAKKAKAMEKAMNRMGQIEDRVNKRETKAGVKDNLKKIWD